MDTPAALLARARDLAAAGRLDDARSALLELRGRLGEPSATLEMNLASVEHARGDLAAAIAALEAAIAEESD